jgi:hypothetical protein
VNNGLRELYIADFDRCTGQLSNHKKILVPTIDSDINNMGLSYSPNGRFLYIVKYTHIIQYDLQDPDSSTAWYDVYGKDTTDSQFMGYASAQLAPNGKIYFGSLDGLSKQMSVIDNPDVKGGGCNFCRKCLRANSYYGYIISPPDMPNYELGAALPCWPVSISQYANEPMSQLVVYPNPASDEIVLESESLRNTKYELNILNLFGQKVLEQKGKSFGNKLSIDVSLLPKGVYVLRVNKFVRKVVKE